MASVARCEANPCAVAVSSGTAARMSVMNCMCCALRAFDFENLQIISFIVFAIKWLMFSLFAIRRPRREEAFAVCDSSPSSGGSFRGLRFVTLVGRKLSRSAIRRPRREEAFAVCDSSPSPGGSFRKFRISRRQIYGLFSTIDAVGGRKSHKGDTGRGRLAWAG